MGILKDLYEIKAEYINLLNAIDAGEIPEEAITDTLDGLQGELNEKADSLACIIKSLNSDAEAISSECDNLAKRAASKKAKAEFFKQYLSGMMQAAGIKKLETPRSVLSFRTSSSLFIADEQDFIQRHSDLCKKEIKITIPKKDITNLIKSGNEISGAELVIKQNLQIK